MPVSLTFAESTGFTVHAAGKVTYDEVQAAIDELLAHPKLAPGANVLTDARDVTGTPSTAELRLIARQMRQLTDRGVQAFAIATDSTYVYGIARMFSVFAEFAGVSVAAFQDMREAQTWLASQTEQSAAG